MSTCSGGDEEEAMLLVLQEQILRKSSGKMAHHLRLVLHRECSGMLMKLVLDAELLKSGE